MATFLVTGGCGFIGSHLCDSLAADGHAVRVLDDLSTGRLNNLPAGAKFVFGDVGDGDTVRAAMDGVDGCFHLAAVSSVAKSLEDWAGTHRTNLSGAVNIFEAARDTGRGTPVPVVYASSAAVYGDNAALPLDEDAMPRPLTPYGADKLGCELHARVATLVHRVPTVGFRFFNVYGPRQDPGSPYSGVISIFADRILHGGTVEVHGDGHQVRDFVYVADVVRFLRAGMDAGFTTPEVMNVCSGQQTTVLQLARTLSTVAGAPLRLRHGPSRAGDIRVSLGDPAKGTRRLGLRTEVEIGEGLRETVGFMNASGTENSHAA